MVRNMERMKELVALLNEYARAYYTFDAPVVSDADYDALYDELVQLEHEFNVVLPDSPTLRVGGETLSGFEPHVHLRRLWSLDKVRTEEGLCDWIKRMEKARESAILLGRYVPELCYILEYKFDGLTVNLTYDDGKLVQAATRGNGIYGEGILEQVRTIRDVPLTIPHKGKLEVQGECYMKLSVLEALNHDLPDKLKNARNAAAGALRNIDPKVTASRRLSCYCYNIGYAEDVSFISHRQMLDFLMENGFPVSEYHKPCMNAADILAGVEAVQNERGALDFLIDGMVIKIDDMSLREDLGYTEKHPRWAIAYKFPAEEKTTLVEDVIWQVGRTGKLTPLAILSPIELSGATISRATLNNIDDIRRKHVRIGSTVFVRRSNDVIPEILSAVEGDENGSEIIPPDFCPECGAHVEQRGVHLFCTNSLTCKKQISARLSHFASRNAMDIDAFSDKTADKLIASLGISEIPQLYELTADKLYSLSGFGKKKAEKLIDAIEKSKNCTLSSFLFALGIPNVGITTARNLSKRFKTLDNIMNATYDELLSVDDVGDVVAKGIADFFGDIKLKNAVDRLLEYGINPKAEQISKSIISGKTIVVTGSMERMSRSDIEELIASLGGKPASSVSSKTDIVVAGPGAGSKLDKARSLNKPVMTEEEFFDYIGWNGSDENR